jgi:hypothetical protein
MLATGTPHAVAQTITFAEAFDRLDKACATDIEKHCGSVQLGGGKMKACLEQNRSRNTAACNSASDEVFAQLAKRTAAQASVPKVCEHDVRQYCSQVKPGDGFRIQCLVRSTKVVSRSCQQTIVDAGWNE